MFLRFFACLYHHIAPERYVDARPVADDHCRRSAYTATGRQLAPGAARIPGGRRLHRRADRAEADRINGKEPSTKEDHHRRRRRRKDAIIIADQGERT